MPNEVDSSHRHGIRLKLQELLGKLAEKLGRGGRMAFELHLLDDIHAYYIAQVGLLPPGVMYIRAYPGLSSASEAVLDIRVMDYSKLSQARQNKTKAGDEHEAFTREVFSGLKVLYDAGHLESIITSQVPELA